MPMRAQSTVMAPKPVEMRQLTNTKTVSVVSSLHIYIYIYTYSTRGPAHLLSGADVVESDVAEGDMASLACRHTESCHLEVPIVAGAQGPQVGGI